MGKNRIISVHIPKTAGTSFLKALEGRFGSERVIRDYGNRIGRRHIDEMVSTFDDFNSRIRLSDYESIECIHGHFTPQKYKRLLESGWIAITWLRDPASQLYSFFRHIQRTAGQFNYLPDTIAYVTLREKLDFKQFALHPMTQNFVQRFFTDTIPYAFVGITERYREDLDYFSRRFIGSDLRYSVENCAPEKTGSDVIKPYSSLQSEIERVHERDYMLYRHYLSISLRRGDSL